MGVIDRFEKSIERVVNGALVKAFRSQVEPVELAAALRKEADTRAAVVSRGRVLTANTYVFELSANDYERLEPIAAELLLDLRQVVGDHAVEQGYSFVGPVTVTFEQADDLDTGMYRVRASTKRPDGSAAAQPPNRGGYDPVSRANPIVPEVYAHQAQSTPGDNADTPSDHLPVNPALGAPPVSSNPMPAAAAPSPGSSASPAAGSSASPAAGASHMNPRRGAPSRTRRHYAVRLHGQTHPLEEGTTVFGRSSQAADIVIDDPGASRRHFTITIDGDRATATDLDSTNGTLHAGRRITTIALTDGVELLVGDTPVTFRAYEMGGR
ncbi:DUF3662 and FHA domain-containing protein [Brevibacterium samyangense]|uniref:Antibiotic biosynthesis regulator FhaA n=1 Tax=Brevibacterium samyangense TaxID=366888 RepID=A0ABN2T311_9MICO